MSDNIDNIDNIDDIDSFLGEHPEFKWMVMEIIASYTDAIDHLMESTCQQDVRDIVSTGNCEEIFQDIEESANNITKKRMEKYANIFYVEELERIMDKFNSKEYDRNEFFIRCEILTYMKNSMQDFVF